MSISANVVSPAANSEVAADEVLVVDITGGDVWIAAQYDSSASIEVVHDGTKYQPRFAGSTVASVMGANRYSVRRVGGWPVRVVTLKYYEGTGGGGGDMGAPIVDKEIDADSSGDEVTALQLPFDADLLPAVINTKLEIAGGSSAGTAIFRAYIGGASAAQGSAYVGGGTFVGSVTVSVALALLTLTGAPLVNPGGGQRFTLTYQSSGIGATVTKGGVTGSIQ